MAGSIVLIGFMGAGKTTVGKTLADRLSMEFVDTDRMVVERSGRTIADIWRTDGEEAFRDREYAAIQAACGIGGRVIATGGGAVLHERNLEMLRAAGPIVYLQVSLDQVEARIGAGAGRPLMADRTTAQRETLLAERAVRYDRIADIAIDTDDRSPDEVAELIIEALR
ncbi:MAG: shikimate kinase [Actinomycetota bacterium]